MSIGYNPIEAQFQFIATDLDPNFSYKLVIEDIVIPVEQQMIVYDGIEIDGATLEIDGCLVLLSDTVTDTEIPIAFKDKEVVVDADILLNRVISLDFEPLTNSLLMFVNGLLVTKDGYNIIGLSLTLDNSLNIMLGDLIDIRYAS